MKQNFFIYLIAFFGFCKPVHSQNPKNELTFRPSSPLHYAQEYLFQSKILNEERRVNIYLPESFYEASSQHRYPVLLLLENEFFFLVSGMVKHLSSVERMPETIVVSLVDEPSLPPFYTTET